jgi:hypothetical protein
MTYLLIPLPFLLAAALLWRSLARRGYVTVWPQAVVEDDGEYSNE